MNRMQHAHLARALIRACGGVDAAAEIGGRSPSAIGRYQDAKGECYMPADVITALEEFCGEAVYSAGLSLAALCPLGCDDLEAGMISANLTVGRLVADMHAALSDGRIDYAERQDILPKVLELQNQLSGIAAQLSRIGGAEPIHTAATPLRSVSPKGEAS